MYVIEVIPLTRGSHIESLTYYSKTPYHLGVTVEVPVRKSMIQAIVIGVQEASTARTAVRAATFSLKKLPAQQSAHPLPPSLMETAKMLSTFYPAQMGAILFALLPPEMRDGSQHIQHTSPPLSHADIRPETEVLQATYESRFTEYRSKIRETFAHRGSVLFVVPTSADIDQAAEILSQGIEDRVVVFSPHNTKKKSAAAYDAFYDLRTAKLIVCTPSHAYLDRHDITHIIVDQSHSKYYRTKIRPYIDHKRALQVLARVTNRTLTLGDILPQSEDEFFRREDVFATHQEQPKRLTFPSTFEIVKQKDAPGENVPFTLFSKKLKSTLEDTIAKRGNVFVYAARRGLAPVVACLDCGFVFRCPDSGTPYSLFKTYHNGTEERWFLSSSSGKRIRARDVCDVCGSWRLKERGIGIQHIQNEMHALFPDIPVFLFDHTTATTYKKARIIIGKFYDAKGAVLLGTQMALPYLEEPVETTIITSLDAVRSIPSWRAEEEFLRILLLLREKTKNNMIVQTRTEPDETLDYAKQGSVEKFYTDELELRRALQYPPFSVFILLTWQGTKQNVLEVEQHITQLLSGYKLHCYSAPQSLINKTRRYGLIRIDHTKYPDEKLVHILRSLPPSIKIEVNPERIV